MNCPADCWFPGRAGPACTCRPSRHQGRDGTPGAGRGPCRERSLTKNQWLKKGSAPGSPEILAPNPSHDWRPEWLADVQRKKIDAFARVW